MIAAWILLLGATRVAVRNEVASSMNDVDESLDAPPGCSSTMTCPAKWEIKRGTSE